MYSVPRNEISSYYDEEPLMHSVKHLMENPTQAASTFIESRLTQVTEFISRLPKFANYDQGNHVLQLQYYEKVMGNAYWDECMTFRDKNKLVKSMCIVALSPGWSKLYNETQKKLEQIKAQQAKFNVLDFGGPQQLNMFSQILADYATNIHWRAPENPEDYPYAFDDSLTEFFLDLKLELPSYVRIPSLRHD